MTASGHMEQPKAVTRYRLSPVQEGILFHALYAEGEGVYLEQRWCLLDGDLDAAAFRLAWQALVDRHDVLRTGFDWREQPMQTVYTGVALPFRREDWQDCAEEERQPRFERYLAEDRQRGFDLQAPPLMRCALFKLGPELHYLVWSYHHLLMDGWCNGILIAELGLLYSAYRDKRPLSLPAPVPFQSFIDWLYRQPLTAGETYWRGRLANAALPTPLSIERSAGAGLSSSFNECRHRLSAELGLALNAFAAERGLTLNTLVQGAWALWLSRCAGRADVVFGAVVANRPPELADVERTVGLFINTVPVRVRIRDTDSVDAWLRTLQDGQLGGAAYAHCGLADIRRWLDMPGGSSLFDSILVFENYPFSSADALAAADSGLAFSAIGGYERSHYPLALMVIPQRLADGATTLEICLRYDSGRIVQAAAERLPGQLESILRGMIAAAPRLLGELTVIDANEWQRQIRWGLGPKSAEDSPQPLPAQIARQARRAPERTALTFIADPGAEPVDWSYGALERHSARIAERLRAAGVGVGARVGVCLRRSPQLVAALWAVWRTGAAYVPLDPDYPAARLNMIVEDAGLALLLHDGRSGHLTDRLPAGLPDLDLTAEAAPIAALSGQWPEIEIHPASLAYVIFTSGSTGRPKGVAISHAAFSRFIAAMRTYPGCRESDTLLALTTIAFDIAGLELWLPLASGARLLLAGAGIGRDAAAMAACLNRFPVGIMQATPSAWRLLAESGWASRPGLKMLCGGEALEREPAERLLAGGGELWNMYGPTETTVWSAALRLDAEMLAEGRVPIGGPTADTALAVLDDSLRPLPGGVAGQLFIGGHCLARGYSGQPAATAAAFLPSPYPELGGVLYRTGDRVRFREDGLLEFLGRIDNQIKLRGFRIELADIEAALHACPLIEQAVAALQQQDGEPYLAAYLVLRRDTQAETALSELGRHLQQALPAYMLPSCYRIVEALPLTPNGKVDRQALPALETLSSGGGEAATLLSDRDRLVAGVWSECIAGAGAVGADDDFFALGGHSLAAMRVAARLQTLLGFEVPVRLLFEYPRLGEFCRRLFDAERLDGAIPVIERTARLPLSWAQRRQWLLARIRPGADAYNIPILLRLDGGLVVEALQSSLAQLVQRHEMLRSAFVELDGEPWLQIRESLPVSLAAEDFSGYEAPVVDAEVRQWIDRPFDLSRAPLWRARLLALAPDRHLLALALHHGIVDDWSLGLLVRELSRLYAANRAPGAAPALPELPIQYADYAAWERRRAVDADLAYWQRQLDGLQPPPALPFKAQASADDQAGRVALELDAALCEALAGLAKSQGATLFMVLLAGFYILLMRYSGSRDLLVATPIADRARPETRNLVGLLVNTLLLRADLSGMPSVAALLARVRASTLDAYRHGAAPFQRVLETVPGLRSADGEPVPLLFALQDAALHELELADLHWTPLPVETGPAKFQLSLSLHKRRSADGERIGGVLEYRSGLFDAEVMQAMAGHYRYLLGQMALHPRQSIAELALMPGAEQARLLALGRADWLPVRGSIHQAFSRVAAGRPDAVAVIDNQGRCGYGELERRANRLAHALIRFGITAEAAVGVWGERGLDTIVAILAVLKAGGFYLPLDPQAPPAAWLRMTENAGAKLILAPGPLPESISAAGIETWIYSELTGKLAGLPEQPPAVAVAPDQLAYAMFTSGSTGEAKAVAVAHRGVLRLIEQADYVRLDNDTVMLHAAPLAFDASTFEIWGALLTGGCLVVQGGYLASLAEIADTIETQRVNTLWLTAGLFRAMTEDRLESLARVPRVLAGGDVLPMAAVEKLLRAAPGLRLVNGYGPTETTTFACCHPVAEADLELAAIPIGRPIAGTTLYILDSAMQPQPVGVPGELYIGGDGVARGYWRRPDFSAERFVPNPFFDLADAERGDAAQVLYRSGDLARWRADGVIEFLGRNDRQLKLRGFRIEPGEIEYLLNRHPAVTAAAVDVRQRRGRKLLVAWYVSETGVDAEALRGYLAAALPDYLVPGLLLPIAELPLTANGKLHHAALPLPDDNAAARPGRADNELERKLLSVWQTLLPVANLDRHGNFFEYGGDSIIAMQITGRAGQLGVPLTPDLLFKHQTVAELAAELTRLSGLPETAETVEAEIEPGGELPLTPIQQWFFALRLPYPHHFNQSVLIQLSQADAAGIEAALHAVVGRHDAFRLRFVCEQGRWRQLQAAEAGFGLRRLDLSGLDGDSQAARIAAAGAALQTGLDLERGPLLRCCYFDLGVDAAPRLLVVAHHLVIDVVSWHLLLGDLKLALAQASSGQGIDLGRGGAGFRHWAGRLDKLALGAETLAFWRQIVAPGYRPLPKTGPQDRNCHADAERIMVCLPADVAATLVESLPRLGGIGMIDALLSAMTRVFCDWTGGEDWLLNLESHGRDNAAAGVGADFSRTVGWFTALFPLRLSLDIETDRPTQLLNVHRQRLAASRLGPSYGVLRYSGGESDLAVEPEVVFNFLGRLDGADSELGWSRVGDGLIHPENRRAHLIEINAWLAEEGLVMEWTYASRYFRHDTVLRLAETVVGELRELAVDCQMTVGESGDPELLTDTDSWSIAAAQVSFTVCK